MCTANFFSPHYAMKYWDIQKQGEMLLLFREMCLTYYLISLIWWFYCFYSVHIQISTMCETMTNIPIEDNTSYVLTEDMFDAAMTKEFSFQVSTKF